MLHNVMNRNNSANDVDLYVIIATWFIYALLKYICKLNVTIYYLMAR